MTIAGHTLPEIRKALIAAAGTLTIAATIALEQGDIIPDGAQKWVILALSIAVALGVYQVPNARGSSGVKHTPEHH